MSWGVPAHVVSDFFAVATNGMPRAGFRIWFCLGNPLLLGRDYFNKRLLKILSVEKHVHMVLSMEARSVRSPRFKLVHNLVTGVIDCIDGWKADCHRSCIVSNTFTSACETTGVFASRFHVKFTLT